MGEGRKQEVKNWGRSADLVQTILGAQGRSVSSRVGVCATGLLRPRLVTMESGPDAN